MIMPLNLGGLVYLLIFYRIKSKKACNSKIMFIFAAVLA